MGVGKIIMIDHVIRQVLYLVAGTGCGVWIRSGHVIGQAGRGTPSVDGVLIDRQSGWGTALLKPG